MVKFRVGFEAELDICEIDNSNSFLHVTADETCMKLLITFSLFFLMHLKAARQIKDRYSTNLFVSVPSLP